MKKIGVFLQSGPACGGTYQYNQLIVDALYDLQPEHAVAIYSAPHWADYLKGKIPAQFLNPSRFWSLAIGLWRRLRLPISLWRQTLGRLHPLTRMMQSLQCDYWIFPSQDALYWYPVNSIGVVHDLMHRYEGRFEEVGNRAEFQRREFHYHWCCYYAKAIFVDSHLGKQQLEQSYKAANSKAKVLPYIAARDIQSRPMNDNFDQKYTLPKKFLFYPAQFWSHKNHDRLIKVIAGLRSECPDIHLVLVGSPKNGYEQLLTQIEALDLKDCVHIFGYVDDADMPEFYRRARALVMPTFFGPTNIPPLEAFALNCPVLISGIYAMPEQLGDAALYCDPDSATDMAEKIKLIWQDDALCQRLVQAGQAHAQRWNFAAFKQTLKLNLSI